MKTLPSHTLVFLCLAGFAHAQHQTALDPPVVGGTLPYQISLHEISMAPAPVPTLHSVAAGKWQGQWVLLAGRTAGLHGLTGNSGFDPQYENRQVWVIDPVSHQTWSKSLAETNPASGLTNDAVDSLSSVNTQFHQTDDTLLVAGGYGYKRSVADYKTYDTLTSIDLPGLVAWVKQTAGSETSQAADHIRQIRNTYFQVTGGSLEKLHGEYQLVMGQNYDGRYRPFFNGVYTRQVRRFQVNESPSGLTVPAESMLPTPPQDAYRRRDLNVTTIIEAGAQPGEYLERAVAYSGVFTPDNGAWTVPVVIAPGGVVTMDDPDAPDTLRQGFQIYHCAKVGLYHRATREMHVVMFGGITVLENDSADRSLHPGRPSALHQSMRRRGAARQREIQAVFPAHAVSADPNTRRQGAAFRYQRRVLSRRRHSDDELQSDRSHKNPRRDRDRPRLRRHRRGRGKRRQHRRLGPGFRSGPHAQPRRHPCRKPPSTEPTSASTGRARRIGGISWKPAPISSSGTRRPARLREATDR